MPVQCNKRDPIAEKCADDIVSLTDRQRDPVGLHLNLPSNNPFRNRAPSPSPGIPAYYSTTAGTPPVERPPRPMSTNPFLDDSDITRNNKPARPVNVPEDIFVSLRYSKRLFAVQCSADRLVFPRACVRQPGNSIALEQLHILSAAPEPSL